MADPKAATGIKHITGTCPRAGCTNKAFVQVVVVEDAETQAKIDRLANIKLRKALNKAHKDGQHD